MTQDAFAERLHKHFGLSFYSATVWKIEHSQRKVLACELWPIASVLGVTVAELLGDESLSFRDVDQLIDLLPSAGLHDLERIRDCAATAIAIRGAR